MNGGPSVLIVDNDTNARASLRDALKGMANRGYRIIEADGGQAGLEKVRTLKPDIVVLDLMMPKVDGFEVLRQVRGSDDPEIARTPILMLTNNPHPENQVKALKDLGADDYLAADTNLRILDARIQALLNRAVRAPFQAGGTILGLTCSPNQRVHVTIAQSMEYVGLTKKPLDVDLDEWGGLAAASSGARWRVHAKDIGKRIWERVFLNHPELLGIYREKCPSNLRLRFPGPVDLLRLPLEFMYSGTEGGKEGYVVLRHPFSRSAIDVPRNTMPMCAELLNRVWAEKRPLRVLLIASNVESDILDPIAGADDEVAMLAAKLPSWFAGRNLEVKIDALPTASATYAQVQQRLEEGDYDVVHYAGHCVSGPDPEQVHLPFWSGSHRSGRIEALTALRLEQLLKNSQTAFVYLSACEGMAVDGRARLVEHDVLGLAHAVVHAGVPALLGFRWPVSDRAAAKLAPAFYESLGSQGELDVAALKMREVLYGHDPSDPAWLSPILIVQR